MAFVLNTLGASGADLDDFLHTLEFRNENDPMRLYCVDPLQKFLEKRLERMPGSWHWECVNAGGLSRRELRKTRTLDNHSIPYHIRLKGGRMSLVHGQRPVNESYLSLRSLLVSHTRAYLSRVVLSLRAFEECGF